MASSENLVPQGGEQGSRKQIEAAMQNAGLPLGTSSSVDGTAYNAAGQPSAVPPGGGASPGGVRSAVDLLGQTTPGDFPFIGEGASTGTEAPTPSSEPDSSLQALAASSQSSFGSAVIARLLNNRSR